MKMGDCISRQAAIDAIEKLFLPQTKGETAAEEINRVAWRCALNCAEKMIGDLPTIEPKVEFDTESWKTTATDTPIVEYAPVVRCKDCKEYIPWADGYICGRVGSYYGNTKPDDFCSFGEKSEE